MRDAYLSETKLFFHDVDGKAVLGGRIPSIKMPGNIMKDFSTVCVIC